MTAPVCAQPWRFRAAPCRIFGNLYSVGSRAVCAHLLDTGDGLLLVDTGYPQTVYLLLESIRELGFSPYDLRLILNTHAHYDHIGGTRAVAELTGARTALGAADVPLADGRPELTEAELAGMVFHEAFRPDLALTDGEVVRLGRTAVLCRHTPGHTPGATSYFVTVTDGERELRAGLHGGPGLATLKDDYLRRHCLPAGLRQGYLDALQRLRAEHVDIHLATHPGQNGLFAKQARLAGDPHAFVDPAAWPAYLDTLEAAFRRTFGEEEAAVRGTGE